MPRTRKQAEKIYYSIGEVADMFDVNTSLIRFWEKEFPAIQPHRNRKGTRFYTRNDVNNFHLIYDLVKKQGFTLQGAREKLRQQPQKTVAEFELTQALIKIKDFLLELRSEANIIERKLKSSDQNDA